MIPQVKSLVRKKVPFVAPVARAARACLHAINDERRHRHSQERIRRLLREGGGILLELGAGDKKGEGGWVTVDVTPNCDLFWDLRRGLPFPDASVQKVYSAHFLEHLSFDDGQRLLNECRRILVPGGTFSICVPNARLYIEAYVYGHPLDEDLYFACKSAYNSTTSIDYVNYMAYMGGHHHYMFDEDNLLYLLSAKGFKNAHLRDFDPSLDPKARDFESIYAEGIKQTGPGD